MDYSIIRKLNYNHIGLYDDILPELSYYMKYLLDSFPGTVIIKCKTYEEAIKSILENEFQIYICDFKIEKEPETGLDILKYLYDTEPFTQRYLLSSAVLGDKVKSLCKAIDTPIIKKEYGPKYFTKFIVDENKNFIMKTDKEYHRVKEDLLMDYKCAFENNNKVIIHHGDKKISIETLIQALENDLPEGIEEIKNQIITERVLTKLKKTE